MHYYQFNIGDYRRDTAHLSRVEHGIYRDLIDWYYLDEKPIPLETQLVIRRLRLGSKEEATALQNVLTDFFVRTEEGWVHTKITGDIDEYHHNAEKNKKNGKKGGRPKALPIKEENPVGSQWVPSGLPDETQAKGNQEPLTNNQEPLKPKHLSPGGEPDTVKAIWESGKRILGDNAGSLIGMALKKVGDLETMAALEQANGKENPTNAFAASVRTREAKIRAAGESAKPKLFDPNVLSL